MYVESDQKLLSRILDRPADELRGWHGRSFRREVGLDSLELFEIVTRIEVEFDVRLPEELIAEIDNLDDVVSCVRNIKANY